MNNIEVSIPVKGVFSRSADELFKFVVTFTTVSVATVEASYNTLDDFLNICSTYKIEVVPIDITIPSKYLKRWNTGIRNDVKHFYKTFEKIWKEAAKVTYKDTMMCSVCNGVYMSIFSDVNAFLKEQARKAFMIANTNYYIEGSEEQVGVGQEFYNLHGRFKLSIWKSLVDDMYSYCLYAYGNSSCNSLYLYYKQGEKAFYKDDLKFNITHLLMSKGLNLNQAKQVLYYTFRKFDEQLESRKLDIQFEELRPDSIVVGVYKGRKYLRIVWTHKGFGIVNDISYFEADVKQYESMQKACRNWLTIDECEEVYKKLTEWGFDKNNQSEKSLVEKRKKGFEKYEEAGKKIVFAEDKVEYWRKLAKKYYNLYIEELEYENN